MGESLILFFNYKYIQISKQKHRLIKLQIFSFAGVQKCILTMFKYLTKNPTPNSNLLKILSSSKTSNFCQLRRSQILPGSQSTIKYSYSKVFWCLFFIGLGFSNTFHRNYLKWVWVCNWVHSFIHPFGHLALPQSHDTDSSVWRQLRVISPI